MSERGLHCHRDREHTFAMLALSSSPVHESSPPIPSPARPALPGNEMHKSLGTKLGAYTHQQQHKTNCFCLGTVFLSQHCAETQCWMALSMQHLRGRIAYVRTYVRTYLRIQHCVSALRCRDKNNLFCVAADVYAPSLVPRLFCISFPGRAGRAGEGIVVSRGPDPSRGD